MATISFQSKVKRPGGKDAGASWCFLNLPDEASQQLPSRSMVSVEGTFHGVPFFVTLEPDGLGGHWFKIKEELLLKSNVKAGDEVALEIAPMVKEPEPEVPAIFQEALANSTQKARDTWNATTPVARRDWVAWIVSGKKAETRVKRIEVALSKLSAGSRRPCCFDRSGMYSKEFSSPIAEDE